MSPTMGTMGAMDPNLIVTGISAILQAVQTWIAYRDSTRAADTFRSAMQAGTSPPALAQAATQLSLAPPRVVNAIGVRVQACWTNYEDILTAPPGSYMPNEIDDATNAVTKCVCRELKRLKAVNGTLPPGKFRDWWSQYGCK